jgi:hypothetical protein
MSINALKRQLKGIKATQGRQSLNLPGAAKAGLRYI